MTTRSAVTALGLALLVVLTACFPLRAAETGSIDGRALSPDGTPVSGASVTIDGPQRRTTVTASDGTFRFSAVAPGLYRLRAQRSGFADALRDDVVVSAQGTTTVVATLQIASFTSLGVIGRTSTSRGSINGSSASIETVPYQTFLDRGGLQVPRVLSELPGVVMSPVAGGGTNGASLGAPQVPQIRGALPYETASLIDGHPVSVGSNGSFSPLLVNPALLQDVEVVKGPGAFTPEINYAIGGSVNYRTLEPTRTRAGSLDIGIDRYGGVFTAARATGSLADHRLDYAFGYTTLGSSGPLHDALTPGSQLPLVFGNPPWTIDGHALPGSPLRLGPGVDPRLIAPVGSVRFNDPLYLCCAPLNTAYDARGELAKLRFNLSQQTTLTVSYLGGQSFRDLTGGELASLVPAVDFAIFTPPAGYAGGIAAGTPIPFDNQINGALSEVLRQSLFQAEVRTTVGATAVLARFYSGTTADEVKNYPVGAAFSFSENAWGGIALCPVGASAKGAGCVLSSGASVAPSTVFYDGEPVTFTSSDAGSYGFTTDHVRGGSLELDRTVGSVQLALSFDRSVHESTSFLDEPVQGLDGFQLAPGSSQCFSTAALRIAAPLGDRLSATFADYAIVYGSHDSADGGRTWNDAWHGFNAPRVGIAWRPRPATAWRLAFGGSIAPPYIALLSAPGSSPTSNSPGAAQYYLQNQNNGQVRPETAFGYDLGVDHRLAGKLTLSFDAYLTNLRDLYLQRTFEQGTYTPAAGADAGHSAPLYITSTDNLGHARFEGLELQLVRQPRLGPGFVVSASFERAYPYAIPPDFWATASGPYTANLAILPNVNFQPGGTGFNGFGGGRIPYAQGYVEINEQTAAGARFTLGANYYGPNNPYNRPAFAVVSADARVPLGRAGWLQLAAENLTNAYGEPWSDAYGGVPVPLVTGLHGATTGYLGPVFGGNIGPTSVSLSYHHAFGER